MSIELVMLTNHLILCYPLLCLPSIFPRLGSFPRSQVVSSGLLKLSKHQIVIIWNAGFKDVSSIDELKYLKPTWPSVLPLYLHLLREKFILLQNVQNWSYFPIKRNTHTHVHIYKWWLGFQTRPWEPSNVIREGLEGWNGRNTGVHGTSNGHELLYIWNKQEDKIAKTAANYK